MRARLSVLLLAAVTLVGCDQITGAADQKIMDAEAIGYACRVSLKTPEDCMKENDSYSPTSILTGWKSADGDILEKTIDPTMGKTPPPPPPQQPPPQPAVAVQNEVKPAGPAAAPKVVPKAPAEAAKPNTAAKPATTTNAPKKAP